MNKPLRTPQDKKQPKQDRYSHPKFTVSQVKEAMTNTRGLISAAARSLGCDRTLIYDMMDRHPELTVALKDARELQKDVTEDKLFGLINKGDLGAICFYLKCQAKDRGYIERVEFTGKEGGPIEVADRTALLNELSGRLARIAATRRPEPGTEAVDHGPVGRA